MNWIEYGLLALLVNSLSGSCLFAVWKWLRKRLERTRGGSIWKMEAEPRRRFRSAMSGEFSGGSGDFQRFPAFSGKFRGKPCENRYLIL